jgi:hypothetical protein
MNLKKVKHKGFIYIIVFLMLCLIVSIVQLFNLM